MTERFKVRCLGLMRGADYVGCESGDTKLRTEDKLILLGNRQNLRTFGDNL
jgi:trk system potassium uptake protein TrkA